MLAPEAIVPLFQLFTRHFAIPGSGVKALMAQVFLQHAQTVAGIIDLHSMDGKGITQTMGADIVDLACLRVDQVRQSSPAGAVPDNLPGAVAVDAEDEQQTVSFNRTAAADILLQHLKCLGIDRQHPLPPMLKLSGYRPCHF